MSARATRLSELLCSGRHPRHVVAWSWDAAAGLDQFLDWETFACHVAGLRAALAAHPRGRWALFTEDSYAFAVGLLALWEAGSVAVSPPNAQPGTLERLGERIVGAVSDLPELLPDGPLLHPLAYSAPASEIGPVLERDAPALELFTSGTTGEGKPVAKELRQLEDEVLLLERRWGSELGDARVLASPSHQHLYGLLFRVLWPLAAGRAFHAGTLLHRDELLPRMRAAGPCALVSVPAHLKRLGDQDGLAELGRCCRIVFSSGGPLAPDTAARWARAVGAAPVEIFGSTETGGVGWRRQGVGPDADLFVPFEGVSLEREEESGRLRVTSPFASDVDERGAFTMGDLGTVRRDGRFALAGRADRVLKVGEKRVSLPEMEARLRAHRLVGEVALVPVDQAGEQRVAAVIVPTDAGRERLEEVGRRAFGAELQEFLAGDWDRVMLPRIWRTVAALPRDAQGKTSRGALRSLFEPPGSGAGGPDTATGRSS